MARRMFSEVISLLPHRRHLVLRPRQHIRETQWRVFHANGGHRLIGVVFPEAERRRAQSDEERDRFMQGPFPIRKDERPYRLA